MPWSCYLVERAGCTPWEDLPGGGRMQSSLWKNVEGTILRWGDLNYGAMWFEDNRLHVKLPGTPYGSDWDIDLGRICKEQNPDTKHPVWNRTGDAPNITVTPSINWVGHYHGWLTNGILTSDCEGRQFVDEPK